MPARRDACPNFLLRLPEVGHSAPLFARGPIVIIRKLIDEERCRFDDGESLLRFTVNEFRSELERQRNIGDMVRENAAADALARFENDDRFSCAGEVASCGKTRRARSDDDCVGHIRYSRTISAQGSLRTCCTFSSICAWVAFSPRTRRR